MQGVASAGEGYYKRGRGMPVAVGTAPDPTTAPTLTSSNGVRRGGGGALLDGPQYGRVRGSSSGASSVGSSGRRGSGAVGATPPLAPTTVTVDFSVPPDLLWGGAAALGAGPVQPSGAASSAEQGGQGGGLPAGGGPGGSSPVSVDVVDMRGLHSPTMRRIRMQARGNGTPVSGFSSGLPMHLGTPASFTLHAHHTVDFGALSPVAFAMDAPRTPPRTVGDVHMSTTPPPLPQLGSAGRPSGSWGLSQLDEPIDGEPADPYDTDGYGDGRWADEFHSLDALQRSLSSQAVTLDDAVEVGIEWKPVVVLTA